MRQSSGYCLSESLGCLPRNFPLAGAGHALASAHANEISLELGEGGEDIEEYLSHRTARVVEKSPMSKSRPSPALAVLSGILLMAAAALSACGEEPATPQTPGPDRTIQSLVPVPAATQVSAPTETPVPGATHVPIAEELTFAVTAATTWGDVFSTLTRSEWACVQDTLEPGRPDALAGKPIHPSHEQSPEFELIFSCLDPQVAGHIHANLVALTFEEQGLVVGEAGVDCLRVWASGLDWPSSPDMDQEDALLLLDRISVCLADAVAPYIIAQINQSLMLGLDDGQEHCVREFLSGFPPPVLLKSFYGVRDLGPGLGIEEELREGMTGCVPEFYENQPPLTSQISMPVEISDFLRDHGIWRLAHNLLFIAHWDVDSRRWLVLDVAGEFTPDLLAQPEGVPVPSPSEVGGLTQLEKGKIYDFHMRWNQIVNIVEGERGDWCFNSGANFIEWWR